MTKAEVVYGKQHVAEHHKCQFYKTKFLKTKDPVTNKMYGFPEGLPGYNEGRVKKVHFIGHSMGALTVRYFQYLLKIGYFD